MRIKLVLLAALAALSGLALVPSAEAASSYIKVTSSYKAVDLCRPAGQPTVVNYALEFFAKIKRRNSPKPKSVRITYKVLDAATGSVIKSGTVTLTARNKFRKKTPTITVTTGQSLTYDLVSTYRAPRSGKKVTAKATIPDQVPPQEAFDQANPPVPTCAV